MKRILQLGLILLCLASIEFLSSCGKKKPQYYLFEGVTVFPVYGDTSGFQYPEIPADSVRFTDHFFEVRWKTNFLAQKAPDVSLIKSAYAFQFFRKHVSKAMVQDVKIVTLNNFNAQQPAGSDITHLIHFTHYEDDQFQLTKDQFVSGFNKVLIDHGQLENKMLYWTDWKFKVTQTPDLDQMQNYQLIINLDNGTVITEETGAFFYK